MSENELNPVETQKTLDEALEFFNSLKEVKFTNDEEYENGVQLCKEVKGYIKLIEDDRKKLVKPLNDKVKGINSPCKDVTGKLENAERVLKNGMAKYFREKEQKRIAEQKRLEAEAEERRRQEAARAERERAKSQAYRENGRDEMADKAEARAETAESIASTVVAPIVNNTAKVKGTSFTVKYKVAGITDKTSAVMHCLKNDVLANYIQIDIKGIERLANIQKGNLQIPGIQIVEDTQVSMR